MSICSVIDRLIRCFEENSLSYVCHNLCNVCAWNLIKHIGDAILCMIFAICLHIAKIRFVLENFGFSIKTCIFFIIRKFEIHRWNQDKKWCDAISKHCRWIISYRTTVMRNNWQMLDTPVCHWTSADSINAPTTAAIKQTNNKHEKQTIQTLRIHTYAKSEVWKYVTNV